MKKILPLFLVLLLAGTAFASPIKKTILAETRLSDDNVVSSNIFNTQDYKKIGFFVDYDETQSLASISATFTAYFSHDGTNWTVAYIHDYAGGDTPQESESIAEDMWYYCWLKTEEFDSPFMKITVNGKNCTETEYIDIIVYMVGLK